MKTSWNELKIYWESIENYAEIQRYLRKFAYVSPIYFRKAKSEIKRSIDLLKRVSSENKKYFLQFLEAELAKLEVPKIEIVGYDLSPEFKMNRIGFELPDRFDNLLLSIFEPKRFIKEIPLRFKLGFKEKKFIVSIKLNTRNLTDSLRMVFDLENRGRGGFLLHFDVGSSTNDNFFEVYYSRTYGAVRLALTPVQKFAAINRKIKGKNYYIEAKLPIDFMIKNGFSKKLGFNIGYWGIYGEYSWSPSLLPDYLGLQNLGEIKWII